MATMSTSPSATVRPVTVAPVVSEAPQPDVAEHEHTFRVFTKGMAIFAAHIGVILLLLAAATL